MDVCFGVVAAALCFLTVVWGRHSGYGLTAAGALAGASGASLYLTASPVFCGVVLLGGSLGLVCVTMRRSDLLPVQDRAVLITGCDSGFGHALATVLSEMGVRVFAGVLDVGGAGAQRLREGGSERLQVLQLDVTDSSQIQAAHQYIRTQVGHTGLWGLVNNAGILPCPADAELQPMSACRRCVEVNFLGAVNMCQVFLPLLRRCRGRIVNVSSMSADVPIPMFAAYGASKAALRGFSAVMRLELAAWGVNVALIQPGGFRTNIFGNGENIGRYRDELLAAVSSEAREDYGEAYISSLPSSLAKMSQQFAEDLSPVVDDMCHALLSDHPRALYTPGQMGWLLPFLHRHSPTAMFDFIMTRLPKYTECEPAGLQRS